MRIGSKRRTEEREDEDETNEEEEYEMEDIRDEDDDVGGSSSSRRLKYQRGSRFALLANQLGLDSTRRRFSRERLIEGFKSFIIHPDNRWYKAWEKFILIWAVYSSFFTPMEFGFFRGLPEKFYFLDVSGQAAFFVDVVLQFFVAYRDTQTYRMIYRRTPIALRYLKSHFIFDLLSCMPWDNIYKASGRKEEVRYLLLIRLSRVHKLLRFFQKLEKDIRINYLFSRIVKLIAVELYCTHTAACMYYYLATTLPPEMEGYTWIGSLTMGDFSYSHFRELDLWKRYTTSLYFAIVTMATVGYGDIHAVNMREMIFVMVFVSFDMVLGAYLIGNMTALIVKGSKTEKYRDKMADLLKYMNRNRLGRDIRNQIKAHLRLQYESSYTDAAVLRDIPISIRAKISEQLYKSYIEDVALFKGCSSEFLNQIVTRVNEEFFLPGEVIMEQGNAVDQLYVVCHGELEEVGICEDGSEETVSLLKPNSVFGEISIFCNMPQPYTVRVCELCRLLRINKQSLSTVLEIYFHDGRRILNNLLEGKKSDLRLKQLETDISLHIGKHEAELALKINNAAYNGDIYQLKNLVRAGADPNKKDYDGRSPLHLAASKGFEDITLFLIQEGVDINDSDNFGNTPLLEAIEHGHDQVASLLIKEGASLNIDDTGSFLCSVVARGDSEFLKRLLSNGIDPNSKDYDLRTPLHIAASRGFFLSARLLVEAGASVSSKDRWGNTPIDEARLCGNRGLTKLLEEAESSQESGFSGLSRDMAESSLNAYKIPKKKCTVYPYDPRKARESNRYGIVLWIPQNIDELITTAAEQLNLPHDSCIVTEDAGRILDSNMIVDGQKLYLTSET